MCPVLHDNWKTVIGCKLVLFTNRKLQTGFVLVLTSVTLDDLEQRNDRRCELLVFHMKLPLSYAEACT